MFAVEAWLPWMVIIFGFTSLLLYSLPRRYEHLIDTKQTAKRVQILVLGDIGRSPRMQFHALSIARHGGFVDLIGYVESDVHPDIIANPASIEIHALKTVPKILHTNNKRLFILLGPVKVLFQMWILWMVLGYRTKAARSMLVQTPPSIPTLFIAQIVCFLRNTRLVIDWHNFGHTILALKLGETHPLVRLSRLYESTFAGFADAHLCVTNAMARYLEHNNHEVKNTLALHDRPASGFRPHDDAARDVFLDRLPELLCPNDTEGIVNLEMLTDDVRTRKAKLLVSSTSWGADENFSILLDALTGYSDLAVTTHPELPEILAIITGKGPLRAEFIAKVEIMKAAEKLEMVTIHTAFLSTEDYAKLLASADLGVSLHTSSSGLDLPMKVVDMFGAGLPVVGWGDFEAWPELVHENVNGKSFSDAMGLKAILMQLFGADDNLLRKLKQGAVNEGHLRWDDEWNQVAKDLFFPSAHRDKE